jgi:hypothetical protein
MIIIFKIIILTFFPGVGGETLSLTFGGNGTLRAFEIKACRRMFSTKSVEGNSRLDEVA